MCWLVGGLAFVLLRVGVRSGCEVSCVVKFALLDVNLGCQRNRERVFLLKQGSAHPVKRRATTCQHSHDVEFFSAASAMSSVALQERSTCPSPFGHSHTRLVVLVAVVVVSSLPALDLCNVVLVFFFDLLGVHLRIVDKPAVQGTELPPAQRDVSRISWLRGRLANLDHLQVTLHQYQSELKGAQVRDEVSRVALVLKLETHSLRHDQDVVDGSKVLLRAVGRNRCLVRV